MTHFKVLTAVLEKFLISEVIFLLKELHEYGPGAQPASYKMGTGSVPVVKRPGRGDEHPLPSSAEVKEREELHLYSPSAPSWPVIERTSLDE